MEENHETSDDNGQNRRYVRWWEKFCLRCHQEDSTPSWQPLWWSKVFPFPIFSTYRQMAQQICIIMFFLLTWGIMYAELGESIGLNGELLSMSLLVISAYLIGWIWLKITTLPALIGMLLTGIAFQNLQLVHMTDSYRKLNQDLRKIALVIILTRAGLGLDAGVLRKHYAAVLQLGLLPWLVECIAITVSTHYLLNLPWIWGFLLGSMIASVSPAVVVPCLFRLRDVGYGVSKGIPTIVVAAAAVDDSISVAIFAIILNAMFSTGSATFNIVKGPLSIIAGVALGSLWGAMTSVIPEKGDTYVVPLRFLALFLGGLFSYFISSMVGWSGAGPLAIVSSGFVAAYFWEKQGWPVNKNPVSNIFRILWIFFEPILFAFTGAQVTISALDPEVIKMATICLVSCLTIRGVATYFVSFGCGLNSKEKIFIGLTWTAKATVQAALGPAALDIVNSGQTSGAAKENEEYYTKTILAVSVLSVMISAPLGALLIALAGPKLLTKDTQVDNGGIVWKEYCKSVTLIGIATGGLECDIELLLSCVYDAMVFYIGKKELENLKNIDQIKRDLRQCYPILDYLLESLDPNVLSSPLPTLVLDLIQSILCPQAQQLQQALDNYAERVTGRWACLIIHGHLVATSSDFCDLDPREARLMLLLAAAQDGAPLRDTPVYLPQMSPNVAFRAVTCKLLADVYILVVCGATPALSQIDEIVLQCWEGYASIIKEAKLTHPRNFPMSLIFEPCVLGVLVININKRRCVFSRHLHITNQKGRGMSGAHRMDILRTFYVTSARDLAPELKLKDGNHTGMNEDIVNMCETYWYSEYHKCHAQRTGNILCCTLYASTVQMQTIRLITNQILQDLSTNKDVYW